MMEMNETVELEVLGGILEDFPTKDATANSSVSSEELQKVSIKRGKGRLVQDGARISRGVKGKLKVNIKVTTISEENFKEIVHQVTNTYRGEHYEQLEERARHNEGRTSWLLGLFGIASGGSYDKYRNQTTINTEVRDTKLRDAVKDVFNKAEESCKVIGDFEMVGMGTETTATVFAEVMTIETEDKEHKIQIVSDRAIPGNVESGSGKDIQLTSSDVLDIVPFL
ncbi:hypothetical protein [Enterococcus sp. DIV0170]|uniref:hypothetical protein n=1 Tax=Enterococcus sp. DIV0170 TaxID=2774642 RepID=UPI003F20B368